MPEHIIREKVPTLAKSDRQLSISRPYRMRLDCKGIRVSPSWSPLRWALYEMQILFGNWNRENSV